MNFRVVHLPTPNQARSAFRIVETTGREVDWVNRYLDYECLRRMADLTLRSYAQHLLHFLRWWESVHHTDVIVPERSPSPPYWITCAFSPHNNHLSPAPPSTNEWPSLIAPYALPSRALLVRLLPSVK